MKFVSTRNINDGVTIREAVFRGLAPDGGLYMPAEQLDLRDLFLRHDENSSFVDIAADMTAALFPECFTGEQARELAKAAFPFSPVLRTLEPRLKILELFHGPSCAFKDFGASYLAGLMEFFLRSEKKRAIILTATSGDTGSAVAQAFHNRESIDVVILYPSGRVSPSQELQLTTVGGNVTALEVQGSFDDCQRMVKEAFLDPSLNEKLPLTSANSINLGRLIPQSFYYAWAFAQVRRELRGDLLFTVPSGNFGNLTAGALAWFWGLPVSRFIAATNRNDVVPEYLQHGFFTPRSSVHTLSNAMDVGNPSNFERLLALFDNDWKRIRTMVLGAVASDEETEETMNSVAAGKDLLVCPHTAVGIRASREALADGLDDEDLVISLATADPAKFPEIVSRVTGREPAIPPSLAEFTKRKKQSVHMEPDTGALKTFLLNNYK